MMSAPCARLQSGVYTHHLIYSPQEPDEAGTPSTATLQARGRSKGTERGDGVSASRTEH